MKSLLLVNNTLGTGGVESVIRRSARLAKSWGVEVRLAIPEGAVVENSPVEVVSLPRQTVACVGALRAIYDEMPPGSVVHVHHRRLAMVANLALGLRNRGGASHALVEHVHNVFDDWPALSFRAPFLIAAGNGIARMLIEQSGRDASRVRVLYNCADRPAIRTDVVNQRAEILGIGRLVQEKAPLIWGDVVEAVVAVARKSVSATWFGDGPLMQECADRFDGAHFGWRGNVTDLTDALVEYSGSMLLSVSVREALPVAAIEALATGIPVVARDVGSMADIVADGITGLLLPYDASVSDFQDAVVRLLDDSHLFQTLQAGARRRYEELFTPERYAIELERIYDDLGLFADDRRPPRRGWRTG